MPLPAPPFENRSHRELLNEALARAEVHTPEWTNKSDSDPGVTLLGVIAFMASSVGYRANLLTERMRRNFLHLLGIPLRPAAAAEALVSFSNPRGPLEAITLDPDQKLFAGKVPFSTTNGLDLLPVEAKVYYKAPLSRARHDEVDALYRRLYDDLPDAQRVYYETRTFTTPESGVTLPVIELTRTRQDGEGELLATPTTPTTLDGALWLALLARPREDPGWVRRAIARRTLTLGVLPALDEQGFVLRPGVEAAAPGSTTDEGTAEGGLVFEIPDASRPTARYRRLPTRGDGAIGVRPGVVELVLPGADELRPWEGFGPLEAGTGGYPPDLSETGDEERLVTWIRISTPASGADRVGAGTTVRLSWVGINAAHVVQRSRVVGEVLPPGTGEPDQKAWLAQTPVLAESVQLTVNGELWQRVEDLTVAGAEVPAAGPRLASEALAGPPRESRVYTVDRESGEICFGDGHRGTRLPRGARVTVTYDYGGGRQGMVGIGVIKKAPLLPTGLKLSNPGPSWGGDEAESVAAAEKAIPAQLRHQERLVTATDFVDIVERTPGVDLGRVEVLPLFHPSAALRGVVAEGVVTVLVIPRHDPVEPRAPRPDRLFLEAICRHLEPRLLVTSELHVRGPEYVALWVTAGIEVVPGRDAAPVLEQARRALEHFLSPLTGGFEGGGWPLGKAVEPAEISAAVTRVEGVASVADLQLGRATGDPLNRPLLLEGLELPHLVGMAVEIGDAPPLDEIRDGREPEEEATITTPVPVLPVEC